MNPYGVFRYVPLSVLRTLARFVAWVILLMPNLSINRSVHTNLMLAYPRLSVGERKTLHKHIVINQCLTSVESVKSWAMPPEWSIAQIGKVHNQAVLEKALASPKGMLAIVPHLGTWEVMNAWLNQFGSPTIMYKPVKGKLSNDFVLQGRQRLNATLVPTDGTGVKAIFKTLKEGGFSIVLPDHVPDPSGGVVVPFFGIPCLSSTLAPKLASKTGCALVGLSCIRTDDGRFEIFCTPLENPDLYHKDPRVATLALNHAMQKMIAGKDEHYMWGYRRFKYVPSIENIYWCTEAELKPVIKQYHGVDLDNTEQIS